MTAVNPLLCDSSFKTKYSLWVWGGGGWGAEISSSETSVSKPTQLLVISVQNQGLYSCTVFGVVKQFSHPM